MPNEMIAQASVEHLPVASGSVDLIFTDPPYLREYLHCYDWLAREAARVLKPGGFVMAMCGGLYLNKIFRMFDDAGLEYFYEMQHTARGNMPIVWKQFKDAPNFPIVALAKPIIAYCNGIGRPRMQVMNVFEPKDGSWSKQYHHWGQDVESARYYIDCFSKPGDLVLDPFIGGGTTSVACKLIGRRCLAFDIDPVAIKTTVQRLAGEFIPVKEMLPGFAGM